MTIPVFHSYAKWYLSGVNTWSVNLISANPSPDFDSMVLFTGIPKSPQLELDNLDIAYDFLDVPPPRKRLSEWRALKTYLESHAPCIYITNFDFHRSCAVGTLAPEVRVIAVIHSDEACYFDELHRIGKNCDAIVCVSSFLSATVKKRFPALADRVFYLPHGIPISSEPKTTRPVSGPLRLCFCNRLQQYQKRVFDLPLIAAQLERLGVAYELDIAGDGPDAEELRSRFKEANLRSKIRFHGRITNAAVMGIYRRSHIFLLTSDFEGLPISLLEAMSVGCVPVVYDIKSGIADAMPSDDYGCRVPHGQGTQMAERIKSFDDNRKWLEEKSENAQSRILEKFTLEKMCESYMRLFTDIVESPSSRSPHRTNRIVVPHELRLAFRLKNKFLRLLFKMGSKSIKKNTATNFNLK